MTPDLDSSRTETPSGKRVSLTGKLASMSREEAAWRLRTAGAEYVEQVDEATDWLIVGQGGPPLGADGRLTAKLAKAQRLHALGLGPEVLGERDWLARMGDDDGRVAAELRRLYTREQLCRILGVSAGRLRAWMRAGLIRPAKLVHRLALFEFSQVAHARSILALTEAGVGLGRIRQSLEQLAGWMPEDVDALAMLEVLENGQLGLRVEGDQRVDPSGQLLLEFDGADEAADAAARAQERRALALEQQHAADRAFERGLEAEEDGLFEEAIEAYGDSLRLGGPLAEINFNLGNVLQACGRTGEAVQHYLRATAADAEYVEAWNNLGNALASLGRPREAVRSYQRALRVAPTYADAHFNLAETFASLGELEPARKHWRAYLAQDPSSPWAREVRERLSESESNLS